MAALTTAALMGATLLSGAMSLRSSREEAHRAEAEARIAGEQGDYELKRSAKTAEQAMKELENARSYERWKQNYVLPVLQKSISDPRQGDPAALRAKSSLAQNVDAGTALDKINQGVSDTGFDFGGNRYQAAEAGISGALPSQSVAGMGASSEMVRQQGISNTAALVDAGRKLYKQQGII